MTIGMRVYTHYLYESSVLAGFSFSFSYFTSFSSRFLKLLLFRGYCYEADSGRISFIGKIILILFIIKFSISNIKTRLLTIYAMKRHYIAHYET